MNPEQVNIPIALFAGLLSFASPCVMPLVPAYLGYLSGKSVTTTDAEARRLHTFWHALAFVLGFSTIFVGLGASISAIGRLLFDSLPWLQKIGGVIIVLFGLHTIGLLKIPFLYEERRLEVRRRSSLGLVSSFLMGVFFSAGWVPCVGPILATILLLAGNVETATQGAILLGFYSLGLGIPFLVAGLAFNALSGILRQLNRYLSVVSIASGVFLVVVGVLIFTGYLSRLGAFFGV